MDHLMARESNEAQAAALVRAQPYFGEYRLADAHVGDTTHRRRDWVKGW